MFEQYEEAVKQNRDEKIYKHSLALEACMGALYDYFSKEGLLEPNEPSKEDWLLAGLIHDIDYADPYKDEHPNHTSEALAKYGLSVSDTVLRIVKAHAPKISGIEPKNKAEWSIFCCDSLTGLITAVGYVYPSRKLADVKVSSILKRFHKEPRFAAGTRREEIILCEKEDGLNLSLETLSEICLTAMRGIADKLGL
ncbi:MAG TPA: phosphohydrolase [Candidatus Woesebacteria bacterium]|nr:phosphohydrolase [Candidatus Woesebacteria bacterium]